VAVPRAEHSQVEHATAEDQHLPDDRDSHPPFQPLAHERDVGRLQRFAKEPVIEAVLDDESQQERDKA
jgi:hypothetical protein